VTYDGGHFPPDRYALEPLPDALHHTLTQPDVSDLIRLVEWDDRGFSSRDDALSTRDEQASRWVEDENSRREIGALNHCMADAQAGFDWAVFLDPDEHIVVSGNSSHGTVSLCGALLQVRDRT
jgi:hypothetical protein